MKPGRRITSQFVVEAEERLALPCPAGPLLYDSAYAAAIFSQMATHAWF